MAESEVQDQIPEFPQELFRSKTLKELLKMFRNLINTRISRAIEEVTLLFTNFMANRSKSKGEELNKKMEEMLKNLHKDFCDETERTSKIHTGDTSEEMKSKYTFCMLMMGFIKKLFVWLGKIIATCVNMILDIVGYFIEAGREARKSAARKAFAWTVKEVHGGYVWTKEAVQNICHYAKDTVLAAFSHLCEYFK